VVVLLPHHREHLHQSALTDATIERHGFYSCDDPHRIARILNWQRPAASLGKCLVMPFTRRDGSPNGFAMVRPDNPLTDERGRLRKYESPAGVSPPVAGFPLGTIDAVNTPRAVLGTTEGWKKALASDQSGCPCVALSGTWNWQVKRGRDEEGHGKGPRELIPDLAGIDWRNRPVWIAFDSDPERKPSVLHARAELARVLAEHGARVVLIDLPHGPRGPDGLPSKMAVDDFILAHGPEAFRELVESALAEKPEPRTLEDWRAEMSRSRVGSIDYPRVYLDTSPPGSGKTYADMPAAARAGSSLIVVPTHANCREVAGQFQAAELLAEAYPELSKKTCQAYETAAKAIESGLAASAAVCPGCLFRPTCDYQTELAAADEAAHRIATHQRAVFALEGLAKGRRYIAIHEDAISVIRPTAESASTLGFSAVAQVADEAGRAAKTRGDDTQRYFFWRLGEIAQAIGERLQDATDTAPIDLPAPVPPPKGTDAALFGAMQSEGIWPAAEPMRICRAAAGGELAELVVRVDRIFRPGGKTESKRAIVAVWQRILPADSAVWLSDATADPDELAAVVPDLIDATPGGRLAQQHPAVQVPIDVKKSTAPGRMLAVVRGLLEAFFGFKRIGVILDRRHAAAVQGTARKENLDPHYRERIARVEHFRSGQSRGSNSWLDSGIDLLLVVGTPRVPESAVRARLIRTGNHRAANRPGRWEADYWSGIDLDGRRHTIRGAAYRDHDWHLAHRAIVRAELVQAIGRGRGILPEGCPVVVASNEELGLPLAATNVRPLTRAEAEVLVAVRELTTQNSKGLGQGELTTLDPKRYLLEFCVVTTRDVARAIDAHESHTRRVLANLADRGLIHRIGKRGGWRIPTTAPPSGIAGPAAGSRRRGPAAPPPGDGPDGSRAPAGPSQPGSEAPRLTTNQNTGTVSPGRERDSGPSVAKSVADSGAKPG